MAQHPSHSGPRPTIPGPGQRENVSMMRQNEGLGRALRDAFQPRSDPIEVELARLLDRIA